MRAYAALILTFCLAFSGLAATSSARRSTTKKSPSRITASTTRKVSATSLRKGKGGKRVRPRQRKGWRTAQLVPTPERYREIQQALIDKNYLQGPPSGIWGTDCTQALKRYQQDQNLEPSGKLDSLTLISLGLGPRREPLGAAAVLHTPLPETAVREQQ